MKKTDKMETLLVGLTGGAGVGKGEVSKLLTKHGALVISADAVGHRFLDDSYIIRRKVTRLLGPQIITPNGRLDRKIIGEMVFGDYEILRKFNHCMHPPLIRQIKREMKAAAKTCRYNMVVIDAALIYEWGIANWFDFIIVVDAPKEIRLKRLEKTGLPKNQIARRIAAQMPQKDKITLADYAITNKSTLAHLKQEVGKFAAMIKKAMLSK
jgi:dephospho-CoA kinase